MPYLLGFHPHESLVVIGIADTTVTVTARVDLDQLNDPALRDVFQAIQRGSATGIVAIIYTESAEFAHWHRCHWPSQPDTPASK